MKQIRVLIIDHKDGQLIKQNLSDLLASLELKGDFDLAKTYETAEKYVFDGQFGLICLGDILEDRQEKELALELVEPIIKLSNSGAAFALFGEASQNTIESIKEEGLKLSFLKNDSREYSHQIIKPDELEEIREAIIKTGVVSFVTLHKNLADPVIVYSQSYADSTPSENEAMEACDAVSRELNKKKIKYSAADHIYYYDICIESKDVNFVKDMALHSKLGFWSAWMKGQ